MTAGNSHVPSGRKHAVVWIDHHEARISHFDDEVSQASHHTIKDEHSPPHLHHKANTMGSGHAPVNHAYLEQVAADMRDARAILIAGPSSAKHELYRHLEQHHRNLLNQVVGVETVDHPTQGAFLAHAVHAFRSAERLGRPYSPGQS
jgi:stalled ribosome rescue protein Dom34